MLFVTINLATQLGGKKNMCSNGYTVEERKYYGDLGDIAGMVLEGMNLVDAAATKGMTADEYKKALKTDIRRVNPEAYLRISKALMSEDEYLSLLADEFWPSKEDDKETSDRKLDMYISQLTEVIGEEQLKAYIENNVWYKNYSVYSLLAAKQGYKKINP